MNSAPFISESLDNISGITLKDYIKGDSTYLSEEELSVNENKVKKTFDWLNLKKNKSKYISIKLMN